MLVDLIQILTKAGTDGVTRIRQNLAASGQNASGSTSRSVRFEVTTEGTIARLRIIGRAYFMAVETGIKPYPKYDKPSISFVNSIKEWLKSKGLMGPAYAIARNIHKFGTKLWQKGGRKDIVSNVIPGLGDEIRKAVLAQFVKAYLDNINASNRNQ